MAREEETTEDASGGPEEGDHGQDAEAFPALIAVHPMEKSVVVAIGSELRVFDLEGKKAISLSDDSGENIRAICFSAGGSLFASAANDKLVKVWATDSWTCIRSTSSEKRVCALAISHDSQFVLFADKFGVIWVFDLYVVDEKPSMLLGHYCSIITSLKFSLDGQFIASADRDFKIRVTLFPKRPLKGAHEIQSFCLGHTDYVSCLSFVRDTDSDQTFLLSGSGDSTVRLWDFLTGCLLDMCQVGLETGLLEPDQEDQKAAAVIDLCVSNDGRLIAVAIQRLHGVVLLSCDFSKRSISFSTVVIIGDMFLPTSLSTSASQRRIWTVMGASLPVLARVRSLELLGSGIRVLEDGEVPGGIRVLECLQGRRDLAGDEAAVADAAEEVVEAVRNLMVKRQYSTEDREIRKRGRGDMKHKERYQ